MSALSSGDAHFTKENAPPCKRIGLNRDGTQLSFAVPWRNKSVSILIFTACWLGVGLYGMMPKEDEEQSYSQTDAPHPSLLTLIGFGGVTALFGIIKFVNKTSVTVSPDFVRVVKGPLWFGGETRIATKDIYNFSVQQAVRSHNFKQRYFHQVDVVLKDGSSMKLCTTESLNETLYIERELEKFLGISDNSSYDNLDAD